MKGTQMGKLENAADSGTNLFKAQGNIISSWEESSGTACPTICNPEGQGSEYSERKRFSADVKSFSHELDSKGVRPFPFWKPLGSNNMEEVLVMIRGRFEKAKEEVDSDLAIFAADVVGILEKDAANPAWQEAMEDLLILARSCAMTSPNEFWHQCESIVQELDDKRQELPPGFLKQLHTRMFFILTRCTRLLKFREKCGFAEDGHALHLCQSINLQPVNRRRKISASISSESL